VLLRDPGGAVLAVTDETGPSLAGVIWHHLNTVDALRAAANYVELFGWALTERVDVESFGVAQQFAWSTEEPSVGSIGDIEGRPGVHPHWTFFFGVASLDDAVAKVRSHRGLVLGPTTLPSGVRVAVCDDAQGAAFGLMESGNRV
jgi:predicted enzyme related to lactoylglutathione lyase